MAAHQPLRASANERAKVDAVVLIEPAVLIGDQHREIARIDLMRGRRQTPAPVGQSEGPEQPAVAIDDNRRAFARGGKIERAQARRVAAPGEGRARAGRHDERQRGGEDEGEARTRHAAPSPVGEALIRRFALPSPRWRRQPPARPLSLGKRVGVRARLTSPSPPNPQRRCGRSARGRTCLRPWPADRCSGRARRRARHRPW